MPRLGDTTHAHLQGGHGVSRQIGQTGQNGLIRAKFDGIPRKTHNNFPGLPRSSRASRLRKIKGKIGLDKRKSVPPIKVTIRRHDIAANVSSNYRELKFPTTSNLAVNSRLADFTNLTNPFALRHSKCPCNAKYNNVLDGGRAERISRF